MEFHVWLTNQTCRQDAIGKLARQLVDDPISPSWSNRISTYRSYLIYKDAEDELVSGLENAFNEWYLFNQTDSLPHQQYSQWRKA